MDTQPEITDDPNAVSMDRFEGHIEFKNVWFAYKKGEWILKDVSFEVKPGQRVAFVGETGAGKTTIQNLICRYFDIQKGEILIDGVDVRKIKVADLRRNIGQMLQDVFLFAGDIKSNIRLNEEGISDQEVIDAAKYVNADGFISKLDGGYDHEVIERGAAFSAGQRQLLSFARTIIHNPAGNDFLVVNQYTVQEHDTKRPDMVVFVNGLPLVVIELKSPSREETDASEAFLQLRNYQKLIPSLFIYNAFNVMSDMALTKIGTVTAKEDRYMEWKQPTGEVADYDVAFRSVFTPKVLLNLLKKSCFPAVLKSRSAIRSAGTFRMSWSERF